MLVVTLNFEMFVGVAEAEAERPWLSRLRWSGLTLAPGDAWTTEDTDGAEAV